jgi:hypothetical protein
MSMATVVRGVNADEIQAGISLRPPSGPSTRKLHSAKLLNNVDSAGLAIDDHGPGKLEAWLVFMRVLTDEPRAEKCMRTTSYSRKSREPRTPACPCCVHTRFSLRQTLRGSWQHQRTDLLRNLLLGPSVNTCCTISASLSPVSFISMKKCICTTRRPWVHCWVSDKHCW